MNLFGVRKENKYLRKEVVRLRKLCDEKDSYFMELMSDALRHGSPVAGRHMADRKKFIRRK